MYESILVQWRAETWLSWASYWCVSMCHHQQRHKTWYTPGDYKRYLQPHPLSVVNDTSIGPLCTHESFSWVIYSGAEPRVILRTAPLIVSTGLRGWDSWSWGSRCDPLHHRYGRWMMKRVTQTQGEVCKDPTWGRLQWGRSTSLSGTPVPSMNTHHYTEIRGVKPDHTRA